MKRALNTAAGVYMLLAYGFLYLPMVVLVLFSFQAGNLPLPPFTGPSLHWYREALSDQKLTDSLVNSILVAFGSSMVAVLFGFLAAYGCARVKTYCTNVIQGILIAPLSVSYLIIGMGLMVLFNWMDFPRSLLAVGIGHTVINLPLCFAIIYSQMNDDIIRLEQVARDLGAKEHQVLRLVVAPALWATLAASFLLSLTLSWAEFLIAFLLTRFETTLPVQVWTLLRSGLSPKTNAIASLVFVISLVLVVVASLIVSMKERREA